MFEYTYRQEGEIMTNQDYEKLENKFMNQALWLTLIMFIVEVVSVIIFSVLFIKIPLIDSSVANIFVGIILGIVAGSIITYVLSAVISLIWGLYVAHKINKLDE